jgi:hypothetical protein
VKLLEFSGTSQAFLRYRMAQKLIGRGTPARQGGVPTLPTSAAIGMGIYLFAGGLKIVTLIKI